MRFWGLGCGGRRGWRQRCRCRSPKCRCVHAQRLGSRRMRSLQGAQPMPSHCPPSRQAPGSMAFVTDSNRPQPLWQPPPTACLTASGAASEVPCLLTHPVGSLVQLDDGLSVFRCWTVSGSLGGAWPQVHFQIKTLQPTGAYGIGPCPTDEGFSLLSHAAAPPPSAPIAAQQPQATGGPIRQLLGAADTQTAHPATFSTAPAHQLLGSANAETTPARAPAVRTQRPNATCEGKNG